MVRVNRDDVRGSCQEWPPVTQGLDYCEEFQIIDVIVSFSFDKGCRIIANGVLFVVFTAL